MPFVNVKMIRGATREQKAEVVRGITDVLATVLGKNPAQTHVVIDEVDPDDWGVAGRLVSEAQAKKES